MTESENTKLVLPYPLVTEGKYDMAISYLPTATAPVFFFAHD